jgi:MYXO-CTERM domain-containing protein
MTLTAISDTLAGFVTAWPEGAPRPETSSLNYAARDIRANAAVVALNPSQGMSLMPSSTVHLVGDLNAAFAPTGGGLSLLPPTRVYDSRSASNPLRSNEVRTITLPSPAGATGVFGTVAVIAGSVPGFVQVFPCGGSPTTSAVNFPGPGVASNAFASALRDNTLCLLGNTDVDVVVDVTGYVTPAGTLSYRPIAPVRLLDTRGATTAYAGRLGARQVVELAVQSLPGAPANVGAAVANVVALGATEPGFVSVFPCGGAVPGTSSLNFPVETPRSTLTLSGLGGGRLCAFTSTRAHLIVDLVGVWVSTAGAAPDMPPVPAPEDDGDDLHPDGDAGVSRADVPIPSSSDGGPTDDRGSTNDVPGGVNPQRPDVPGSPGDNNGVDLPDSGVTTDLDRPGCACRATASTHPGMGAGWLLGALLVRRRRQSATARRRVNG